MRGSMCRSNFKRDFKRTFKRNVKRNFKEGTLRTLCGGC